MATTDVAAARHDPTQARRRTPLVGVAAGALAFVWFAALALARFNQARATSYDLSIFSQAAEAWSRGELPRSAVRGEHTLLADHFSPATALFGGAWTLWPDPRALLLTQAALLGLAVGIVVAIAYRRLGLPAALWVTLTACLGRMLIAGDLFDVHEVAIAVPLVATLCWALLERRLPVALAASAGLLLVKEDLGLTVGMAGLVWWWLHAEPAGRWRDARAIRQGLALCLLGLAGLVTAALVIGHFNPDGSSSYLDYFTGGSGGALAEHSAPPTDGVHLGQRLLPVLLLTATAYVVGWGSPLLALAAPTLAWRLVSSNASYWSVSFHYDLALWPIAVLAAVDAVQRRGWQRTAWLRPIAVLSGLAVMASGVAFIHDKGIDLRQAVSRGAELRALDRLVAQVPLGERIAAQNHLGPYLVAEYDVTMLGVNRREPARWLVFAADGRTEFQAPPCARDQLLRDLAGRPGVRLYREGDLILADLGRAAAPGLRPCAEDVPAAG